MASSVEGQQASAGGCSRADFQSKDVDIQKEFDSFFRIDSTIQHKLVDSKIVATKKSSFLCLCCDKIIAGPLNRKHLITHLQSCEQFRAGQLSVGGRIQRQEYENEAKEAATAAVKLIPRWRKWKLQEKETETVWSVDDAAAKLAKAEEDLFNVTAGLAVLDIDNKCMGSFVAKVTKDIVIPPEMKAVQLAVASFEQKFPEEYLENIKKTLEQTNEQSVRPSESLYD